MQREDWKIAARPLAAAVALLWTTVLGPSAAQAVNDGTSLVGECDPSTSGANRLAHESSPYLLLHACNPVDWFPWGAEAFQKARREGKPIFLSVGYSTCFWCHVMEREAFSDPEIAALMNRWFVSIKVDREERPELDEIYMTATQLLTGSGGWPNSVFLTPALEPFFAGTYFPPVDRRGRPGFDTVLSRIHEAWIDRRPEIEAAAARISQAMAGVLDEQAQPASAVPGAPAATKAVEALEQRFDSRYGGFGEAPKFPSPANLHLLGDAARSGNDTAASMVRTTLEKMSRGGIFDHLGGGFHRYSTDARWAVPHFEKMLYDNAQLGELLVTFGVERGFRELVRAGRATLDFLLAELLLPEGGFKSAIDAETEGEEGTFYTWSREELKEVLEGEFDFLAEIYGFAGAPNFERNRYTLQLAGSLAARAGQAGVSEAALLARISPLAERLHRRRNLRPGPLVDDKVLTDWNGMVISALARAGHLLNERRYVEAAARTADFLLGEVRDESGLLHAWRGGSAKLPAYLDDYVFLIRGLLDLQQATGQRRWLTEAVELSEEMETRLRAAAGGYYLNRSSSDLLFQPRTITDGAIPAANGVAIQNLLELSERTNKEIYRERAEAALRAFARQLEQYPQAVQSLALALRQYHRTARASKTDVAPGKPVRGGQAGHPAGQGGRSPQPRLVEARARLANSSTDDRWGEFSISLTIAPGWHLNANPASTDFLIPTALRGAVRDVRYPVGEVMRFAFSESELAVYQGEVELHGQVLGSPDHLLLDYQACDDRRCLRPATLRVELGESHGP